VLDGEIGLDFDAIVIGAGVSGLYQLYKLRELGLNVRVFGPALGIEPGARVAVPIPSAADATAGLGLDAGRGDALDRPNVSSSNCRGAGCATAPNRP
jgi:2-polyprenyl-6-methoxyphenol hydroxylase-like FAD-dependent oxidoreductase